MAIDWDRVRRALSVAKTVEVDLDKVHQVLGGTGFKIEDARRAFARLDMDGWVGSSIDDARWAARVRHAIASMSSPHDAHWLEGVRRAVARVIERRG